MNPAIGVASHPSTPYDELAAAAVEADVDYVELLMEGPGERRQLSDRHEELEAILPASIGLVVHLPFGGVDIGAPLEYVREGSLRELKLSVELAADLGAEKAAVHADTAVRPEIWNRQPVFENVCTALADLHAHGQRHGVDVCAENVPGPFVSIETFPALLDRTGVPMALDTGHARASGYDDAEVADFVAAHGDAIAHVHLNDTRGDGDEHLPVGMGTVDFASILGALPPAWIGTLTVEALTGDFGYVATGVERLQSILADLESEQR